METRLGSESSLCHNPGTPVLQPPWTLWRVRTAHREQGDPAVPQTESRENNWALSSSLSSFFFCLFRTAPAAYESSPYKDWLSQWGFTDDRGLFYTFFKNMTEVSFMMIRGIYKKQIRFHVCSWTKLNLVLLIWFKWFCLLRKLSSPGSIFSMLFFALLFWLIDCRATPRDMEVPRLGAESEL